MSRLPPSRPAPSYPIFGICCGLVYVACAQLLFPDDYVSASGLRWYSALLATLLLAAPLAAVVRDRRSLFLVQHLIPFGLVYWLLLDSLQGVYEMTDVSRGGLESAFLAVGVFDTAMWVAILLPPLPLPGPVEYSCRIWITPAACFNAVLACGVLTILRYAIPCGLDPVVMFTALQSDRWSAPWVFGAYAGWDAFLDHFQYFGYVLPSLTVVLAHLLRTWMHWQVWVGAGLSVFTSLFLIHGGSRRLVGVVYGAALLCWLLLHGRRLGVRHLAVAAGMVVGLLVLFQLMLVYRGTGFGGTISEIEMETTSKSLRVDDNILRMGQMMDVFPARADHVQEQFLLYAFVRPIPRVFWPGKPINGGFDVADLVGARGVTYTCSIIGEMYISYGWTGVVLAGLVFGLGAGTINRILAGAYTPAAVLVYSLMAGALFCGLRSLIELVLMSYMLLIWMGISYTLGRSRLGADSTI